MADAWEQTPRDAGSSEGQSHQQHTESIQGLVQEFLRSFLGTVLSALGRAIIFVGKALPHERSYRPVPIASFADASILVAHMLHKRCIVEKNKTGAETYVFDLALHVLTSSFISV